MNQTSSDFSAGFVMIVEDNDINMEIMSDFLEAQRYRVSAFTSAEEFFSGLNGFCPDVILMDLKLPGMDGLEATRRLRALPNPEIAATPVIAVTAMAMPGDKERCLSAGANEYVSKPIRLKDLMQTIERYARKGAQKG